MMGSLPPFVPFFVAAALVPALGGRVRAAVLVALPVLGAVNLYHLPDGVFWQLSFLDNALEPVRVDRLSRLFGYLFHIGALLGVVFALHLRDRFELIASLVYAGSALGAVFAGDLITLFVFWELMAVSSVCLIWARRTGRSMGAGLRYLVVQVLSGVLLLGGAAAHLLETGTLAFTYIGLGGSRAGSSSSRSGSSAPSRSCTTGSPMPTRRRPRRGRCSSARSPPRWRSTRSRAASPAPSCWSTSGRR